MIQKKSFRALMILILMTSFISVSCVTPGGNLLPNPYSDRGTPSKNPVIQKSARVGKSVLKFAAGGAAVGAVLAAVMGDDDDFGENLVKGAAIGGAVGALAGYVYGRIEAKEMASRDRAVAKYQYTADKGTFVAIEDIRVNPNAIAKGNPMSFLTTYTVLTPDERQDVNVQMGFGVVLAALDENNDMYNPGQLQEFQLKKGGGTYQVTVPLEKTSQYEPHSYKFIVGIETDGQGKKVYTSKSVKFNVMEAKNGTPIRIELIEDLALAQK